MNIIEAYKKFNSKLIIIISGIDGCGKNSIAKQMAKELDLSWINQKDYYDKSYDKTVTLSDDTTLVNLSTDEAIDWDKFNKTVNKAKNKGLLISGVSFPTDKLKFEPDYHIHISLSKQNCIQRRQQFFEEHQDKYPEDYKLIGSTTESLKMNKLIYPYYLESIKNMKINKFINANKFSKDEAMEEVWNLLIKFIQQFVNWFNDNKYWDWKKESERLGTDIESYDKEDEDVEDVEQSEETPDESDGYTESQE